MRNTNKWNNWTKLLYNTPQQLNEKGIRVYHISAAGAKTVFCKLGNLNLVRSPPPRPGRETDLSEASCGRWGCSSACQMERRTSPGCRPAPPAWAGSSSLSRRSWRKHSGLAGTSPHPHWEHTRGRGEVRWDMENRAEHETRQAHLFVTLTSLHNCRGRSVLQGGSRVYEGWFSVQFKFDWFLIVSIKI